MRLFFSSLLLFASAAFAAEEPPTFNAVLTMGDQHRFVLTNSAGASSRWLGIGDEFDGHTLKAFDAKANELELEKAGAVRKISLVHATIGESGGSSSPATLADAEAMLQSMRFDEMMAKIAEQQKAAMKPMFEQQAARMRIPEEHRARYAELQARILDETFGVMASPEMREAIARLYSEVFTKEELAAMSTFHSTPAGRALIDRQPLVQQRMMEIMMGKMGELGPRMQKMTQDFHAEVSGKAKTGPTAGEPAAK